MPQHGWRHKARHEYVDLWWTRQAPRSQASPLPVRNAETVGRWRRWRRRRAGPPRSWRGATRPARQAQVRPVAAALGAGCPGGWAAGEVAGWITCSWQPGTVLAGARLAASARCPPLGAPPPCAGATAARSAALASIATGMRSGAAACSARSWAAWAAAAGAAATERRRQARSPLSAVLVITSRRGGASALELCTPACYCPLCNLHRPSRSAAVRLGQLWPDACDPCPCLHSACAAVCSSPRP